MNDIDAKVTFEWIVQSKPEDLETLLAIYERNKTK
jgi:hypothetical protein